MLNDCRMKKKKQMGAWASSTDACSEPLENQRQSDCGRSLILLHRLLHLLIPRAHTNKRIQQRCVEGNVVPGRVVGLLTEPTAAVDAFVIHHVECPKQKKEARTELRNLYHGNVLFPPDTLTHHLQRVVVVHDDMHKRVEHQSPKLQALARLHPQPTHGDDKCMMIHLQLEVRHVGLLEDDKDRIEQLIELQQIVDVAP